MRQILHTHLPRMWMRRTVLSCLLLPCSWAYGALVMLRKLAYRVHWLTSGHPGGLVIVVGNVLVGGAGKTPTTIALVKHLKALGLQVGVVSRGHGRTDRTVRPVQVGDAVHQVGDEPLLIQRHTGVPVWVGPSRLESARQLRHRHPDVQVIVCDDGLQHLALERDLEICLVDDRGTGNGWLLPAGPLREPWPRPADLVVHTHGQAQGPGFIARRRLGHQAVNGLGQTCELKSLTRRPVDAVAGLARPERFFSMLETEGFQLGDTHAMPDHHDFADWQPTTSGRALLCTEKDAVKLWAHQPEAWAIPLELELEPDFWQALHQLLHQHGLQLPAGLAPLSSDHGHETA